MFRLSNSFRFFDWIMSTHFCWVEFAHFLRVRWVEPLLLVKFSHVSWLCTFSFGWSHQSKILIGSHRQVWYKILLPDHTNTHIWDFKMNKSLHPTKVSRGLYQCGKPNNKTCRNSTWPSIREVIENERRKETIESANIEHIIMRNHCKEMVI